MKHWTQTAFVGGHSALDFLNTVGDHGKTRNSSRIADWESFVSWSQAAGLFSEYELRALATMGGREERRAKLAEIHNLREIAHAVLRAIAARTAPPEMALKTLEDSIKSALARASLTTRSNGFEWSVRTDDPDWMIDALGLAVENLLRTVDLERLCECGRCTWLFIDRGRGAGRRWCDMRTCGNRAKAEAFRKH